MATLGLNNRFGSVSDNVISYIEMCRREVLVDCPIDIGTGMCYTRACLPSLFLSWTTRHDESWKAGFDRERCARTKCGARA